MYLRMQVKSVCVYIHKYMNRRRYAYTCACIYVNSVYTVDRYVHIYASMYVCMYVCKYVCMYVCMFVHTFSNDPCRRPYHFGNPRGPASTKFTSGLSGSEHCLCKTSVLHPESINPRGKYRVQQLCIKNIK